MRADARRIRVEGPADLELVDRALDELSALWAAAPEVPGEDRMLFAVAVSEVATNVVRHTTGDVVMSIEVRIAPDALHATVRDTAAATAIDLAGASMPDGEAESGRGLALAREVLDVFEHDAAESGSTWTLRRSFSSAR